MNLFGKFLGFGGWKTKLTALLGLTSPFWWPPLAAWAPDQYEPTILMVLAALGITGVAHKQQKQEDQNKTILKHVGVTPALQATEVKKVTEEVRAADAGELPALSKTGLPPQH